MDKKMKRDLLDSINPEDALYVLKVLMNEDRKISDRILQILMERLHELDSYEITMDLYYQLDQLEVEELWDRSGSTRYGYVEPSEEAWVMFEEVIEPFVDEMKKYQKLGMPLQAKKYCTGIIKGIQKYEQESESEFKNWATDVPSDYVDRIMDEWKEGNPDPNDIAEVEGLL
jgi:hypothetical protein